MKFDGSFCLSCVLFATSEVGKGSHAAPKSLVLQPFNRWKDAKEIYRNHQGLVYHKNAIVSAENFITIHEKKSVNVALQLDNARKIQVQQNRKMFGSIVNTIFFIGRQEIACRGHRDAGPISLEDPIENDGNFRSLLRFRMAAGDDALKKHLLESNICYTSPKIQNELIDICGNIIQQKIVAKINRSGGFSILADETTDISGVEQFSLCIRYVDEIVDVLTLREDFLKFVPMHDVTGKGLSEAILNTCKELRINLSLLRGQGYDGARAMSGEFRGCATKILEKYAQAIYVHCANHSLNLAIGDICTVPVIRNSLGTMNEIIGFFRNSAQRQNYLNESVSELRDDIQRKRLTKYCETRWIERLDAIITFKDFFLPIFNALGNIEENGNNESSKKAFILRQTLKNGKFILKMVVIHEVFSLAHPLSVALQAKDSDLASAMEMCDNLSNLLKSMRADSFLKFKILFATAQQIAEEIGGVLQVPRVTERQVHRENYQCLSAEDFFRVTVFIPFIDHFISQLEFRFLKHKGTLSKIQNILPNEIVHHNENEINMCIDTILDQWTDIVNDVRIL